MGSEPIVAHAEATDAGDGVDATMTADLRFPNDVRARVHCSMADDAPFSSRLSIRGRDGTLEVTNPVVPHQGNCLRLETNEGVATEEIKGESTYHYQLDAFLGAIAGNDSAAPTRGCDAIGQYENDRRHLRRRRLARAECLKPTRTRAAATGHVGQATPTAAATMGPARSEDVSATLALVLRGTPYIIDSVPVFFSEAP